MSGLQPTARPFQPSKSWADDDADDDGDITKDFAALDPKKDDTTPKPKVEESKGMCLTFMRSCYQTHDSLPSLPFHQNYAQTL